MLSNILPKEEPPKLAKKQVTAIIGANPATTPNVLDPVSPYKIKPNTGGPKINL
jgi:hypothetical protein